MAITHLEAPRALSGLSATALFARIAEKYERWNRVRRTRAELLNLSDRELADLGLSRYDIFNLDLDV